MSAEIRDRIVEGILRSQSDRERDAVGLGRGDRVPYKMGSLPVGRQDIEGRALADISLAIASKQSHVGGWLLSGDLSAPDTVGEVAGGGGADWHRGQIGDDISNINENPAPALVVIGKPVAVVGVGLIDCPIAKRRRLVVSSEISHARGIEANAIPLARQELNRSCQGRLDPGSRYAVDILRGEQSSGIL